MAVNAFSYSASANTVKVCISWKDTQIMFILRSFCSHLQRTSCTLLSFFLNEYLFQY
jgi:hypothetical protein